MTILWSMTLNLPRHNVNKIGASAAASSTTPMPISRTLMAAAKWLEGVELASLNDKGELILLDDALDIQTTVSKPVLVKNSDDRTEHSLWGLRKELRNNGWKPDDSKPSISSRTFFSKNQCSAYYILLLDCNLFNVTIAVCLGTDHACCELFVIVLVCSLRRQFSVLWHKVPSLRWCTKTTSPSPTRSYLKSSIKPCNVPFSITTKFLCLFKIIVHGMDLD